MNHLQSNSFENLVVLNSLEICISEDPISRRLPDFRFPEMLHPYLKRRYTHVFLDNEGLYQHYKRSEINVDLYQTDEKPLKELISKILKITQNSRASILIQTQNKESRQQLREKICLLLKNPKIFPLYKKTFKQSVAIEEHDSASLIKVIGKNDQEIGKDDDDFYVDRGFERY